MGNIVNRIAGYFISAREKKKRYRTLMEAQDTGNIIDLRMNREFVLRPAYRTINGERMKPVKFVADFTYRMPAEGFCVSLGNVKNIIEWCRGMAEPGARPVVVEVGRSRQLRKDYIEKKRIMAENGYIIMEV